jgi:hypothetical protein
MLYLLILPREIKLFIERKDKISSIDQEIVELKNKHTTLIQFKDSEIDGALSLFNILIPVKEDYYSIISTLRRLSDITGLSIDKYQIAFQNTPSPVTKITIDTSGDSDKLLSFFNSYLVKGGRLVTLDSIEYVPNFTQKSITVNFFHLPSVQTPSSYTSQSIKKSLELSKKISAINDFSQFKLPDSDFENNNVLPIIGEKADPFREE